MIRLLAAIMCAMAARRWPRLWFVVAALAAEHYTSELVARVGAFAPMAWASSSIVASSVGASFGATPRRTACIVALCHMAASMVVPSAPWQVALVCGSSWLTYLTLLARTTPRDVERCVVAMLLAGNATTAALTLAIGINKAYSSAVVSTSNNVTHLVVAGLVLWASRSR
jgi:hypothetical protein